MDFAVGYCVCALIEKYYALGAQFGDNLTLIGLAHEGALSTALDLAEAQAAGVIGVLRSKKTDPALVVGAFEIADGEREGTEGPPAPLCRRSFRVRAYVRRRRSGRC
ncbi:MAG: hypothetical protein EXQ79_09405 [Acidimicrobiia bacterium]|nr:hypothetical protein [Acidimicrobiia bacterium]